MIMIMKILIILALLFIRTKSENIKVEMNDVLRYMIVHKDIILETQDSYSKSIDSEVLADLIDEIGNLEKKGINSVNPLYSSRVIGRGREKFNTEIHNGDIEQGLAVDSQYEHYCNGSNTTLHDKRDRTILLCGDGRVIEVLKLVSRRRRSIDVHNVAPESILLIKNYIEKCKKNCILSPSLIEKIRNCDTNISGCDKILTLAYRLIKYPATIQPSIFHFFDNKPHRKILSIHNSLEDIPQTHMLKDTKLFDCLGKEQIGVDSDDCMKVFSGDFNAVYKLFNNKIKDYSKLHVVQTAEQYGNCEPQDHVWKGIYTTPSITGHHDYVAYSINKINENGQNSTVHCLTTICNLCIREVPMVLMGECLIKHKMSSTSHVLRICSKEKTFPVGYFIRLLHGGSRLDNGYSYRSRFILMNAYTYVHEKVIGSNPKLTDDDDGYQILKGSLKPGSCKEVSIGSISKEWLQYYAKCGEKIYHHNEYLTEGYRCNLKYEDYKLSGFIKWTCYNWYFIRFFIIIMGSILLMYVLWFVGVYKYITLILCMITSPVSYLMYKYWPNFARCNRCGLPWLPWHTCNEICLCGEKFSDEHKSQCDFYKLESINDYNKDKVTDLFKPVDVIIPNVGTMNYINYIKSSKRRLTQGDRLQQNDIESANDVDFKSKSKSRLFFQVFSNFRNPFTVFTVRFTFFFIIYIILCLLLPVSIAECIKCTDKCSWNGNSYSEDCRISSESCLCLIKTQCSNNQTLVIAVSSIGLETEERVLHRLNGCLGKDLPFSIDYIMSAFLEIQGCFKNLSIDQNQRQKLYLKISVALPAYAKVYVMERGSEKCPDVIKLLKENFDIPESIMEGTRVVLNSISDIDQSKELQVIGVQDSEQSNIEPHHDDFKDSIKPIQDVVEESKREEIVRKNGELLQEFQSILNLLKYNGSIFGRDHTITIPQPPAFIQHIYTTQSTGSTSIISMTMQAIAGSASAFRPVHNGKEVPLTFIISVPEVAGVYSTKYLYTSCRTSVIDSVRYDKCVGTCDDCFTHLHKEALDSTKLTKFYNPDSRGEISFDNPNTWGCEGSGCWTIKTGCLCAYCSNVPDPRACYDIYSTSYHSSKALVCLSINEDHKCEHIALGKPIERQGRIQMLLEGNDEWASLIKADMIAISRESGKILTGLMNGLGESSGNFGSPQYDRNLTLLYKISDVDAHYICKSGSDQEVVFNSCFKDTWPMKKDLHESTTFFQDSQKGLIYHIGRNIGPLKVILNVPVEKIEWKTVDLDLNIKHGQCSGCYGCLNGAHCILEVESTHSGLVYAYVNPCIIRVSTLNILRGLKRYNVTIDCVKKPNNPYLVLKDGNDKILAKKALSVTLSEGNTPRTIERNSTNNVYNIAGQNDNTLSGIGDFLKKWNPISAISKFFSSSLIHWILYLLISIILIASIILIFYYLFTIAFRKVTNKVVLGKQD